MKSLIKKYKITLVFYGSVIFLLVSMVFARLVREPYPSLNMPAFTRSGINDGLLPASYFEIIYLNKDEEVWKGNLQDLFNPQNLVRYRNNMHFIFFNQAGTNLEESKRQKRRIISLIPGGVKIHDTLKKWTTNNVIGGAEKEIPKLMYKRRPFESNEVTGFVVNEYKEYYHLVDGFQYREIVRQKAFSFDDDITN
ncbi:hypothetical protein SAMN04488057_105111 [Cyclobacterium lianum]|uniref:Uncharacterized protein n=1 Tax=Cyclobacterium lianum TaxID=388280 RepID=A0A1M7N7H3_9BACT|nr:hypothetical protein [Cyclobacterium lianum]SHM99526.1 hypothetical protein SAMN04488057_105111 [Cyclobacterium lianum]